MAENHIRVMDYNLHVSSLCSKLYSSLSADEIKERGERRILHIPRNRI
jgi:hypothetical protein